MYIFYYCCSQVPIFQSPSAFPLFWFYIVVLCLLHLFFGAAAVAAANIDDMLMLAILIQTPLNAVYRLEFEPQAYGLIHDSTYIIPVNYGIVYLFMFVIQLTD